MFACQRSQVSFCQGDKKLTIIKIWSRISGSNQTNLIKFHFHINLIIKIWPFLSSFLPNGGSSRWPYLCGVIFLHLDEKWVIIVFNLAQFDKIEAGIVGFMRVEIDNDISKGSLK